MSSFKSINSIQAQNLIKDCKDLMIIDVRRYSEFKDRPILIYCKAGHKSALACQMLEEEGFTKLYNLGQGLLGYTGTVE